MLIKQFIYLRLRRPKTSKKESSELEENHDKDKDMDLTEIESIHEVNDQSTLSHQLEGTGIQRGSH